MINVSEETKRKPGGTVYDPSKYRYKASLGKILLVVGLILLMLAAARLANLTIWWNVMRLELTNDPLTPVNNYRFLGHSGYEAARKKLDTMLALRIRKATIVSYFDLLHPAVFLIHNRSQSTFVNAGLMTTYPAKGFSEYFFHPTEILEVRGKETGKRAVYFGSSLFPAIYEKIASRISPSSQRISFIITPIEDGKYLKIPYYIYFYLPLLSILIIAAYYGRTFYIAFFYYLGLFLLFDFKKVIFTAPFSWLINLLGFDVSPAAAAIVSAVLVCLFVIGGFIGLFNIRRTRKWEETGEPYMSVLGKSLIFFFLLLPLFLRF